MDDQSYLWAEDRFTGAFVLAWKGSKPLEQFGEWTGRPFPYPPIYIALCAKLLESGGRYVIVEPRDEKTAHYVTRGQICQIEDITHWPFKEGSLQNNIKLLHARYNKTFRLTFGYALLDDVWRPHLFMTRKDGSIIEAGAVKEKYFGYACDEREVQAFLATGHLADAYIPREFIE